MNYLKLGMVDTHLPSTVAYLSYSWWKIPIFFLQTFRLFFGKKIKSEESGLKYIYRICANLRS